MPIKDVRAGGELQRTRLRLRLGLASGPAIGNTPASAGMKRSEIGSRSSSARAVAVSIAADDRGPRLGACSRTDRGPAVHDDAREGGLAMAWMGKPDTKVSEFYKELGGSRQTLYRQCLARRRSSPGWRAGARPEVLGPKRPTDSESRTLRSSL